MHCQATTFFTFFWDQRVICGALGASKHKVLRVGGTVGYACPEYLRTLLAKLCPDVKTLTGWAIVQAIHCASNRWWFIV